MLKKHDVRVVKILKSIVRLLNAHYNKNMMLVFYVKYNVNTFQKKYCSRCKKQKRKYRDCEELLPKGSSNSNKIFYIFIKMIIKLIK